MKATVLNVAAYILEKCGAMSTMKLQKLVYYCQAWSLAWDDVPLFDEDFQAWAHGPVCPELFSAHKGLFFIDKTVFEKYSDYEFNQYALETIDAVINDLGDKSPQWLSDLTHSEFPWKNARRGVAPGEPSSAIISKEVMQQFYGGLSCEED